MKMIFRLNLIYFLLSVTLFAIEVVIARFAKDDFIRPYSGDFLIVIMMYCTLKTFTKVSDQRPALMVLLFAYGVEYLQYLKMADKMGLAYGSIARIMLGNYFCWADILAYTFGVITILLIEQLKWKFYPGIDKE